jgi:small GTP-binding protein
MQNVKVVVVGNGGAGKTSLLMSAANPFQDLRDVQHLPNVFDHGTVNFIVDDRPVSTGFWDTAGQEDYDRLRPLSYPQTDVFLLCVSPLATSNVDSIQNKWLPELRLHAPNVPILLVETMSDVENSDVFDLVSLAQEEGLAGVARTSAHLREGVDELMQQAIRIGLWHQTRPRLGPQRTLLSIFWEKLRFAISRRRTQGMPPAFFVGNSCEGSKSDHGMSLGKPEITRMFALKHKYYALRHGESLANVEGIISSDPAISIPHHGLSEKGKGQAQKTGTELAATLSGPVLIMTSDFKRARETAEIVHSALAKKGGFGYAESPIGPLRFSALLRERSFGVFNGETNEYYDKASSQN